MEAVGRKMQLRLLPNKSETQSVPQMSFKENCEVLLSENGAQYADICFDLLDKNIILRT